MCVCVCVYVCVCVCERERGGCFTLIGLMLSCRCLCYVSLTLGAMGCLRSAVYVVILTSPLIFCYGYIIFNLDNKPCTEVFAN